MAKEQTTAGIKRKSHPSKPDGTLTKSKKHKSKNKKSDAKNKKNNGPHLPNSLRRELDCLGSQTRPDDDAIASEDEDGVPRDLYEYEEGVPEEETRKNRRFDSVENFEYELPEQFEDEDVPSDDESIPSEDDEVPRNSSHDEGDKHGRMLEGITGIPSGAFTGKRLRGPVLVDTFNMGGSKPQINIHDLLDPLHGKSGYDKLRKSVQQIERKPMTLHTPLPKVEREKLERKVAYEQSKKEVSRWEPLVKRNREAPTIYFEKDMDIGFSTVGSIASTFQPRTEFEMKMAALMNDPEIVEAHKEDGLKLLELNKISVEDVKDRQDRLAKMRSLLFRHDMKQKRIKKIKSKAYHRMLKKDKSKVATDDLLTDPEVIKEEARKQEFKRAEERLRLKHKNKSKWAQRILKRGLNAQDEGTRAAITEQLRQHEQLTRKMNSMRDSSSEESSSDDEDEEDLSSGPDVASKILSKAKNKTMEIIEEKEETTKSGVLSLPFMVRALEKKKEALEEEAQRALHDYDLSLGNLVDANESKSPKAGKSSGRKVFGVPKVPTEEPVKQKKREYENNSDSEAEFEQTEEKVSHQDAELPTQERWNNSRLLIKEPEKAKEAISQDLDIDSRDLGSKTTYEVAIFASGSWRNMPSEKSDRASRRDYMSIKEPSLSAKNVKQPSVDSDVESDDEMVEGFPSSHDKIEYELPSQSDLIRRAFAGDDVELEFEKDKMEALNEEVPEPEKPLLLPGWGQWTNVQEKKGLPSWMVEEHEDAKRKREEVLKKRKDAHLKNVIISEKPDKKTEKLHTKSLPFPFTSKEVFEQNLRVPIGPDFQPATSVRSLNRPAVVKEVGMIIEPIKYEDVDPYEKADEHSAKGKQKPKKSKGQKGKPNAAKNGSK